MVKVFTPPDEEFAAASGTNVNWSPTQSYFDHPPNSTSNLTVTSNASDNEPFLFETGETYDITWTGHGGGNMQDATIIRSDIIGPDQGVVVFEGINSNTGELFQMVWTPGFDLESWYWSNGGGPSSPNAFWTSDQDASTFRYVCYAVGTWIATPVGPRRIETLKTGDRVTTLDGPPAGIVWIRHNPQPLERLHLFQRPVLFARSAFGPGRPERDLVVSPQHRILVGGRGILPREFAREALAPAKSLTSLPGVRHMGGKSRVTWVHFALKTHEVVIANGLFSESLLLGKTALAALRPGERRSVTELFSQAPPDTHALNGPPARELLTVQQARGKVRTAKSRLRDAAAAAASRPSPGPRPGMGWWPRLGHPL